jgi:hypothetical protein
MDTEIEKQKLDYTIIIDLKYPDNDTSLLSQDEIRRQFNYTENRFDYRYKTYLVGTRYRSTSGIPLTAIYQKAIDLINAELGIIPEKYKNSYYDNGNETCEVRCTHNRLVEINPFTHVYEILDIGPYGRDYYVKHRLDTLDVPNILKEYNEIYRDFRGYNIKRLEEVYKKSLDKSLIAIDAIKKLKDEMDSNISDITCNYYEKINNLIYSPFEYTIFGHNDVIAANDDNGVMQLYEYLGTSHDNYILDSKLKISFDYGDLTRGKKINISDLSDEVYCYVRKIVKSTGKQTNRWNERLVVKPNIVSLGRLSQYQPDDLIQIYKAHKTIQSLYVKKIKTPLRGMKVNATKGITNAEKINDLISTSLETPPEFKYVVNITPKEIIDGVNSLMYEMVEKIKPIVHGYHVLVEKIEYNFKKWEEYKRGDILLCKMYHGGYYISQFIIKSDCMSLGYLDFKNDLYGYEKTKIYKPDSFGYSYIHAWNLTSDCGSVPKKISYSILHHEKIIKKIGHIPVDNLKGKSFHHSFTNIVSDKDIKDLLKKAKLELKLKLEMDI